MWSVIWAVLALLWVAVASRLWPGQQNFESLVRNVLPRIGRMQLDHIPTADLAAAPNTTIPNMTYTAGKIFYYATRQVTRLGPITLPPAGTNRNNVYMQSNPSTPKPCDSCVILFVGSELQDANGKRVDSTDVYIKVTKLTNGGPTLPAIHRGSCTVDNQDLFYMTRSPGNHAIYYAPADLSVKTGVHVNLADKFEIQTAIVNKSKSRQHVWLAYTYEFLPGDNPDFANSRFESIEKSIDSCETTAGEPLKSDFDGVSVMEFQNKTASIAYAPRRAMYHGTILKAKGRVDYDPAWIDLLINNRLVCRSSPVKVAPPTPETDTGGWTSSMMYQGQKVPVEMSECKLNETIRKNDEMKLVSHYNLDRGVTAMDIARRAIATMGILLSQST